MYDEYPGARWTDFMRREWQSKTQGVMQWLYPLVIFLMIITLFPLAIGNEPALLLRLAVPAVWISALLSLVIGLDGLFKTDYDSGVLVQIASSKSALPLWVLAKLTMHWFFGAGCVAILSLFATPLFGLSLQQSAVLGISVVIGSPILLCLSAIASSLALSTKNSAILVPLIAIPMQLPVLIFATGAVERYGMQLPFLPIFALLLAGSILFVLVSPWVIAFSLRLAWQN